MESREILFRSLMHNLLHMRTVFFEKEKENGEIETVAGNYCCDPALQPMFTPQALRNLVKEMQDGYLYEIKDPLSVRLVSLQIESYCYIIGPYITETPDERRIRSVLMTHHFPSSFALTLKLYSESFPIISARDVEVSVNAILRSLYHIREDYRKWRIEPENSSLPPSGSVYRESFDYQAVFQRYEQEHRLLHMIETGDTDNIQIIFDSMNDVGLNMREQYRTVYQDLNVGFAMLRTMARLAAERGGASFLEIDDITQSAVQSFLSVRSQSAAMPVIKNMLYRLTEAVHRHLYEEGNYSAPIRRAADYIRLNASQQIELAEIAKTAGLSPSYLSRQFKAETGFTIPQYFQYLRCHEAARLLQTTDSSISDISAYVGYPDGNYFVKVFRKQYGMTPSEYRHGRPGVRYH